MLRVGEIEYANCTPLFTLLRNKFICSDYEFIKGVPAELNRKLLDGEVDVCPSSSIEYAKYPDKYTILPHLSISSVGSVASVLLFSRVPLEMLDGCSIGLSSESATSVNLLKIIIAMKYGCSCSYKVVKQATTPAECDSAALLLIGDAALKSSLKEPGLLVYDLGQLWYDWTGYPFVFALWLCRNEVVSSKDLKTLLKDLIEAKKLVPERLEDIVDNAGELAWMGRERLLSYWRDNISYQLNKDAEAGLMFYYAKCFECGLIPGIPQLKFVSF
ncbi:MAG: menaquinone biosynthesis protein [Desulfuromonadaceae bacterium]|nr:menaquinone biosynthesis protein [Desulfuromonadaceae bacterium]MDD2855167.1 menaquinone biosynthesis protein [Desulfuromonadaceae bacterium]